MFTIDNFKDFKIYHSKKIALCNKDKDKYSGLLVLLTGDSKINKSVISSPLFNKSFIKSYYIPKRVILKDSSNITKKIFVSQKDIYKDIKESNRQISNYKKNISSYKGKNLFLDLSNQLSIIFNNTSKSKWNSSKLDKLKNIIINLINSDEYKDYGKKLVICPISEDEHLKSIEFNKKYFRTTYADNFISAIYLLLLNNKFTEQEKNNLKDISFLFIYKTFFFKFNFSEFLDKTKSKDNLLKFKSSLIKFSKFENGEIDKKEIIKDDKEINNENKTERIKEKIIDTVASSLKINSVQTLTGSEKEITDKIETVVDKVVDEKENDPIEAINELENNNEFKEYIDDLANEKITAARNNINNKRLEKIKAEHEKVKIDNKSINDIVKKVENKSLDKNELKMPTIGKKIKSSNLNDFEKSYNKKQYKQDRFLILESFSKPNKKIPMWLVDYSEENTSDSFTKKTTVHMIFKDNKGKKHTINLDIPNLIDDRYLYINGNKKVILKQLSMMPVVKTKPDTVQVTGNYRKIFISRFGQKMNPKIERMKKLLPSIKNKNIECKMGSCLASNIKYLTTLDYDELAGNFITISLKHNNGSNLVIYFNQDEIRDKITNEKAKTYYDHQSEIIPIALQGNTKIYGLETSNNNIEVYDLSNGKITKTEIDLLDFILASIVEIDPNIENEMAKITVSKRFIYTRASVLSRKIPLVFLLCYADGITEILRKAKIKYEFSDKRKRLSPSEKNSKSLIEFKDGYLYYDNLPIEGSFLMNGFSEFNTKDYDFDEFNKTDVYLDIFYDLFKSKNVGKGFENFIELFIDPITEEVLEDHHLPTDFTSILIYANALLSDNSYTKENDMSLYRIRSNEIINAHLYELLSDAYAQYKSTGTSISLPKDALIKKLLNSTLIEDYSTLNPILEAEKLNTTSYGGLGGLNLEEAFSNEKRSYDPSMMGILGLYTPDSRKVGMNRSLSFDPNIKSTRGYLEKGNKENLSNINYTNILSPSEMLTPFVSTHDDPMRCGMSTIQNNHVVPVKKTDKLLVGTGGEKALAYILSDDFCFKAKKDGKVTKIENDIMEVTYKDNTKDYIDLSNKIVKNGGKLKHCCL